MTILALMVSQLICMYEVVSFLIVACKERLFCNPNLTEVYGYCVR